MKAQEPDKIQCQCTTLQGKRCERIGTHAGGGKLRCEPHHRQYLKERANNAPIKKTLPR